MHVMYVFIMLIYRRYNRVQLLKLRNMLSMISSSQFIEHLYIYCKPYISVSSVGVKNLYICMTVPMLIAQLNDTSKCLSNSHRHYDVL